jgi:argininosuccinate lyase
MRHAEFDVAKMRERAQAGWITVTELADTLAREHHIPFRIAHSVAARVVRSSPSGSTRGLSEVVASATRELTGRAIAMSDDELAKILSPEYFVAVRKTQGGPAREAIEPALAAARAKLETDRPATARVRDGLNRAAVELKHAAADL